MAQFFASVFSLVASDVVSCGLEISEKSGEIKDCDIITFGIRKGGVINLSHVTPACARRIIARRGSYIFFLLLRLARMGKTDEAKAVIKELRSNNLYPITDFIGDDYGGIKLRLLCGVINQRNIFMFCINILK